MNQPATTPDPVRFPILTRHWNFTPIGESADLAIDIIGQRCIARAESEDDFEDYDDEDWDEEESELHVARQKPVLDDELRAALALRAAQKAKTPKFRRTEWYRYFRLARSGWRKPKGMDNKQRRNYRYRSSLVRVGHGKVATARGLHPSGFAEVMVQNVSDLNQIDAERQAARVGATVGGRKREMIHERADELGIRILNRRRSR